jgi:Cys-tRNA(Pro)/Cys-tRNA(Cys) deacylase
MRPVRVVIEETAVAHDLVYLNGGQRGLQLRLGPREVVALLKAVVAPVVA